jgi:hypothetical protein
LCSPQANSAADFRAYRLMPPTLYFAYIFQCF